jgi:hypothetical protein
MSEDKIYKQRFDFYWKSIVIYLVVALGYGLIRTIIGKKNVEVLLHDPVFILLGLFIIGGLLMYFHKLFWVRTLVIDANSITMRNRFNQNKYDKNNIERIYLGKERPFQTRETFRLVKLSIEGRKRKLRIRPHNYWDDKQLFEDLTRLKQNIVK